MPDLTISGLEKSSIRAFDSWVAQMGFTRRAGFYFIIRALVDNRILILDKATKEMLVGASREQVLLEARVAARHEARIVLYEEGFLSDPGTFVETLDKMT